MVGVAPDEGSGRRLPSWMLGKSSADQVGRSDKVEVNNKQLEEGLVSQTSCSEKKNLLDVKEKQVDNLHVLAKSKTRRNRKSKQGDADFNSKNPKTFPENKCNKPGRKLRVPAARKKQKAKDFDVERSEESKIQSMSDDDVDLTVEDLMIIAEEYVRADEETRQEQASNRKYEPESRLSTTASFRNETEGCNNVPFCTKTSAPHDDNASHHRTSTIDDASASYKISSSSTEVISTYTGGTGNPAYDMLDLYLGPLLKKHVEEKKTDFVFEDATFSQDFGLQSQNNTIRETIVPSMKKKSSLKDKVAMFLD
ncbi:hypothetical protein UlMin_041964 [Ulmus minor]